MEAAIADIVPRNLGRTLSEAHEAFLNGDFELCVEVCDGIKVRNDATRLELAFLRARVSLRLDSAKEALRALESCAFVPTSSDGIATMRMLLGAAHVRSGNYELGIRLLDDALADTTPVHRMIRAELQLNRGIAQYAAGRYDEAEKLLCTVDPATDMIYARSLEYRGWVACAGGNFQAAAQRFNEAFAEVRTCVRRDRFVEASILRGVAQVRAYVVDVDRWGEVESQIVAFDWTREGLAGPRFWVAMFCSMMREYLGDDPGARRWARKAEQGADTPGRAALALCRMAAIFRSSSDPRAQREFTERAHEIYDSLGPERLGPDEKQLPMALAEELAYAGDGVTAARLFASYQHTLAGSLRATEAHTHAPNESLVEGRIAEALGERNSAVSAYARALHLCRKMQDNRRGAAAASRLARLTGARRYLRYANEVLKSVSPDYWLAREVRGMQGNALPTLTDNQRRVLTLVARGKTYKEIAAELNRSWKTVNNSVEHLRAKFGVRSRGELVAEALRRHAIDAHTESDTYRTA